jgi:hypothetical protein
MPSSPVSTNISEELVVSCVVGGETGTFVPEDMVLQLKNFYLTSNLILRIYMLHTCLFLTNCIIDFTAPTHSAANFSHLQGATSVGNIYIMLYGLSNIQGEHTNTP